MDECRSVHKSQHCAEEESHARRSCFDWFPGVGLSASSGRDDSGGNDRVMGSYSLRVRNEELRLRTREH